MDLVNDFVADAKDNLNEKADEEQKENIESLDPKTCQFLELTIRTEGFKATAHSLDDLVHFEELVDTPSTK